MSFITNLLKIDYPIVQAPMLGVTTPAMVAAASNAGLLGSLPVGGLPPDKTRKLIKATKALTDKPFAVNLFAHGPVEKVDEAEINLMQDFLAMLCAEHNIPYSRQEVSAMRFYFYEDLVQVLLDENIPVVSFTFGILKDEVVAAFKKKGVVLAGTATSVAEAKALTDSGVDAITVQGLEAGGHRGSFLPGELPQIGLFSLLPQIAEVVALPLLAAGGIYNANTMKAAFNLGAAAVQIGSPYVVADESMASESYKNELLNSTDTSTELTRAFSGRWARGIKNEFMRRVSASKLAIPYYTHQNQLTATIRVFARQNNLKDFTSLWAGQSAGSSKRGPATDITKHFINEFQKIS